MLGGHQVDFLRQVGVSFLVMLGAAQVPSFALEGPPSASVSTQVEVPASMAEPPFDIPRLLNVPPNFRISVHARVPGARFMAVAPNGDLLVSQPYSGTVKLVRPNASGDVTVSDFVAGLSNPHDIVFHSIGSANFVYIAESKRISRFPYVPGDSTAGPKETVVDGLPDSSNPELQGTYGHQLKNIAVDRSHNLYVSIASATNASISDTASDPVRCAIYRYDFQPDGLGGSPYGAGRLFAKGLRNAEGLAFVPGTDELWAAVNNRDRLPYPYHGDITGDGQDDYGQVIQSYVDDHPPEEFVRVREGGNYGWPFANPNPEGGMDNMPFDPDFDNNRDWSVFPEETFTRVDKGIQAHSAPLGLSFLQDSGFPSLYRDGAVIALHGSWNRSAKTGYKVIYFPWDETTSKPGVQVDLVYGWLDDASQQAWGRPVDAVPDLQGNLLISDNIAGAIYKLSYSPPPPPPPPDDEARTISSFSLMELPLGLDISGYEAMRGGTVNIDLATLPRHYSLRANAGGDVKSIVFTYNGNPNYQTENKAPYCIQGNRNRPGDTCFEWTEGMVPGTHMVTATPYSERDGGGSAGVPLTLTLQVR